MPHFDFILNQDGGVAQTLRDGVLHSDGVTLEPVQQIVSTYFKIAQAQLVMMCNAEAREQRRAAGLQAFLMSITGVEAFTNVFFEMLALERNKPDVLARVSEKFGSLVKRLSDCIELAFDAPLPDQQTLLERIQKLYGFRNSIVHPRWEPASIRLSGQVPLVIQGLSQNFQITFEDETFCREAFWWCVKLVAEVGRAAGNEIIGPHCFFWAGVYGLTDEALAQNLGLANGTEI